MLTFQELYGELEASVKLGKEMRISMCIERTRFSANNSENPENALSVHYSGQGTYQHGNVSNQKSSRNDPLKPMGCFTCRNLTHRDNNCPNPPDYARAVAKRKDFLKQKK